ncbi:MAG: CAAX prenyl protease-related protein [Verrucomicrobia bacterium]|nr:CAAX prenyl protease-related protein [Verrucomicrobiota bacterium]
MAAPDDDNKVVIQNAMITHILPFGAWMILLSIFSPATGWTYALRAVVGAGLFLWFCPWRWYPRLQLKNLGWAMIVGILVFVVWILPETQTVSQFEGFHRLYQLVGILPPWSVPEVQETFPYAPEVCGWPLTIVRLLGSAVVIACIEEFFWRGFLYRWMIASNFLKVDLGLMEKTMFIAVAVLFGLEHHRWLAGIFAGLAYGYMVIRTKDIWAACIAHGITNFLLGLYVIVTRSYQFW